MRLVTGFLQRAAACHHLNNEGQRQKYKKIFIFSICIINVKFAKIVAFKGTVRKFFKNMVAVHNEGLRRALYSYSTHFFRVNVPVSLF
jgi:hypothetical protein